MIYHNPIPRIVSLPHASLNTIHYSMNISTFQSFWGCLQAQGQDPSDKMRQNPKKHNANVGPCSNVTPEQ